MKRVTSWLPSLLLVAGLLGYFVAWPWYQARQMSPQVDALIADLDEQGAAILKAAETPTELPGKPTQVGLTVELSAISNRMGEAADKVGELTPRAEQLLPKATEEKRQQLRDALSQFTSRLKQATKKYTAERERIKAALAALKAAKP